MRLQQPTGIWLLLWPCWWSLALASHMTNISPPFYYYLLFAFGAILMRGAGCVINDLVDEKIDVQVQRTKNRPLPSGIVSRKRAIAFLIVLLLLSTIILTQFNTFTIIMGASSLMLVAAYPFMKRITYWPQLFLGFTFNWGALMGWTAITGSLSLTPILLYGAGIFWTLGYDTIYAHQDKEDDLRIGVKSTALALGDHSKRGIYVFYTIMGVLLLAASSDIHSGWLYTIGFAGILLHLVWQIQTVDLNNAASAMSRFKSNIWLGGLIFFIFATGDYNT